MSTQIKVGNMPEYTLAKFCGPKDGDKPRTRYQITTDDGYCVFSPKEAFLLACAILKDMATTILK